MTESQFLDALRDVSIQQVLDEASNATPENAETPEYSEEFNENMDKLRRKYGNAPKSKSRRIVYRAASIILVVVLTLGLMTVSVRAFFPEIWQVFVSWFEDYASVSFEGEHNDTSSELEVLMEPSYVPDGVEIERDTSIADVYIVNYCIDGHAIIHYSQELSLGNSLFIDNLYDLISINVLGYSGYVGSSDSERILVWDDGKYVYRIEFSLQDISEEESIRIAESVKPK